MNLNRIQNNFLVFIWFLSFVIFALQVGLFFITITLVLTVDWQKNWVSLLTLLIMQVIFIFAFMKVAICSDNQRRFNMLRDLSLFLLGLLILITSCWLMSNFFDGSDLLNLLIF